MDKIIKQKLLIEATGNDEVETVKVDADCSEEFLINALSVVIHKIAGEEADKLIADIAIILGA